MKKNMGMVDRGIRIAAAILVAVLYFTGVLSGAAALILGIIAVIFVVTSFVGFCPVYVPLGVRTNKEE